MLIQEAKRVLEAARREGTGWVKVDKELIAKVDAALKDADATLQKAERENSSLYFQVGICKNDQLRAAKTFIGQEAGGRGVFTERLHRWSMHLHLQIC